MSVSVDKAINSFENIKTSIQGLFDILKINFNDRNIYFKMGLDNISGLYKNLIDLMLNEEGLPKFVKKLRKSEVELDIALGNRQ